MPRCDEAALIEIVEQAMHSAASAWLFLRELRVGTGRQDGGAQRLDAFALNTLPHTAMKRVCYEVKTSRAVFSPNSSVPSSAESVCAIQMNSISSPQPS